MEETFKLFKFFNKLTVESIYTFDLSTDKLSKFIRDSILSYDIGHIFAFNKLILCFLCIKDLKYLEPEDKLILKIDTNTLYIHENLSIFDELFLTSFALAYVLQFPSFISIGLNDSAISGFYRKHPQIKLMTNMLMLNSSMLRCSLRFNLVHQYVGSLLSIGMSPMFIYRMCKEYSDSSIVVPTFPQYVAQCIQHYIVSSSHCERKA